MNSTKIIDVVAAVIARKVQQNVSPQPSASHASQVEVLVFQRLAADFGGDSWEFPGGKVEAGESDVQALEREIQEELSIAVRVSELLASNLHQYPQVQVRLRAYFCKPAHIDFEKELRLTDHQAFRWVNREQIQTLSLAAADVPLVGEIFAWLESNL